MLQDLKVLHEEKLPTLPFVLLTNDAIFHPCFMTMSLIFFLYFMAFLGTITNLLLSCICLCLFPWLGVLFLSKRRLVQHGVNHHLTYFDRGILCTVQ